MSRDLLPCPFCDGGETRMDETRGPPRMSGESQLIGVYIYHWCAGRNKGAQRLRIEAHGRDHADAIEAWNMRAKGGER